MNQQARDKAQMFYATVGMYTGFASIAFLVLGVISLVTYFFNFHKLWLVLILFGLTVILFGIERFAKSCYWSLDGKT